MVISIRRKFQRLREDLVSGIELRTERKVLSFMSDHDYAADVFVLDGAPGEQARSAEPAPGWRAGT